MHYRGAFRVLVHRTHTTLRLAFGEFIELCMWHCSVNYAAGSNIKRCNFIGLVWHYSTARQPGVQMMSIVLLRPFVIATERSTVYMWYVRHKKEFHTHVQYLCNSKVGVSKSWLHWPTVLYRSLPPFTTSHQRILVHEPQNLEIALREVGDFQMIVLPFGVWVIGVAPRRLWKMI